MTPCLTAIPALANIEPAADVTKPRSLRLGATDFKLDWDPQAQNNLLQNQVIDTLKKAVAVLQTQGFRLPSPVTLEFKYLLDYHSHAYPLEKRAVIDLDNMADLQRSLVHELIHVATPALYILSLYSEDYEFLEEGIACLGSSASPSDMPYLNKTLYSGVQVKGDHFVREEQKNFTGFRESLCYAVGEQMWQMIRGRCGKEKLSEVLREIEALIPDPYSWFSTASNTKKLVTDANDIFQIKTGKTPKQWKDLVLASAKPSHSSLFASDFGLTFTHQTIGIYGSYGRLDLFLDKKWKAGPFFGCEYDFGNLYLNMSIQGSVRLQSPVLLKTKTGDHGFSLASSLGAGYKASLSRNRVQDFGTYHNTGIALQYSNITGYGDSPHPFAASGLELGWQRLVFEDHSVEHQIHMGLTGNFPILHKKKYRL